MRLAVFSPTHHHKRQRAIRSSLLANCRSLASLGMTLFAGCYTYSTIDLASAAPGMEVRARVSAATAAQLGPSLGMSDARLLSGPIVQKDADGLTIRVPSAPMGTIGAQEGLFQQILIGRSDLLELESRQLDRTRTGVMIGAAFVGATAIAVAALHGHSTGDNAVTDPPANFNIGSLKIRLAPVASRQRSRATRR